MMEIRRKVAILGATSHIARGLTYNICSLQKHELVLYARSPEQTELFVNDVCDRADATIMHVDAFGREDCDVVINCIGAGNPAKVKALGSDIFRLTERYDNVLLDYLALHPDTLYINLSSGAVYGTDFSSPATATTKCHLNINHLAETDFYGIAKIHAEAKHRALPTLNIVDIRVFSYFSRFIDLSTKFLMTDILTCLRQGRTLETNQEDITRDYIHPRDLMSFVEACMAVKRINDALDAYSVKPVKKSQILDYFASHHGLRYITKENRQGVNATGSKQHYYSESRKAADLIGYAPKFTSLDCIIQETAPLLASS